MKNFIKVTRTDDTNGGEIWISIFQIIYMEDDVSHPQSFIYTSIGEIKVNDSVSEILSQFDDK